RNGNIDAFLVLPGQRGAAVAAETALCDVGRSEMLRRAARPRQALAVNVDQKAERPAGRLLAHAAIADRRLARRTLDAKAHRAALASAGMGLAHRASSQVVTTSPVAGSFESLSAMPMEASSSRMRSPSLKSLDLRALLRASTRCLTRSASSGSVA